MNEESDGIAEAFDDQLCVAITAAGMIAERFARSREKALREAEARGLQEGRELRARIDGEGQAAVAQLSPVHQEEWWDSAQPDQIGRAYETAHAWSPHQPEAARAQDKIRDEVRHRYGVNVGDANGDPVAVREAVERAGRLRSQAAEERARAEKDTADGRALVSEADRIDQAAEREANKSSPEGTVEPEAERPRADEVREEARDSYDSAERRETMAHDLEARGIYSDVVAARVRADVGQGRPATEVTKGAHGWCEEGPANARPRYADPALRLEQANRA